MTTPSHNPQLPRCGGRWTEAQYISFIRSTLRGAFLRYPVRGDVLREYRKPYGGEDKRIKWVYECSFCHKDFFQSQVHIDHIVECGKLTKLEHATTFIENLFCEIDGLRILCKPCHKVHTLASKEGVSFEQAERMKKAIAFSKLSTKEQIDRLKEIGEMTKEIKNASQRREAYLKWLEKQDE